MIAFPLLSFYPTQGTSLFDTPPTPWPRYQADLMPCPWEQIFSVPQWGMVPTRPSAARLHCCFNMIIISRLESCCCVIDTNISESLCTAAQSRLLGGGKCWLLSFDKLSSWCTCQGLQMVKQINWQSSGHHWLTARNPNFPSRRSFSISHEYSSSTLLYLSASALNL